MRRPTAQIGRHISALTLCAVMLSGCVNLRLPQIDPSGDSLLANPTSGPRAAFREVPRADPLCKRTGVILCPRATVAPVGSEVVLLAGVRGPDEYLRTNERVEWMIDPESVGQFVDLDEGSWTDPLVGDFTNARKIDNTYAVNTTSRRLLRLTRGTPDSSDDVDVLKGQAWVTLTSATEGTSNVTVYCPGVSPWEARTETCQVHWVDAQWSFPSVALAEAGGRQTLKTTVTRQTDNAPRSGWIVRYEICDGPPAGFAPDESQVAEVTTDAQGQASVELFQKQPRAGTSKISIQVIRPAGLGSPNQRLVIGRTCLTQTWSAPSLDVRISGPATGSIGSNLGFRIDVSNPGDMPAEGISLNVPVPPGLSYVSASPTAEGTGGTLRWNLGRLSPGEVRSIALDLRSERDGQYEVCAEAAGTSGLSARSCASVAVEAAELKVEIEGPTEATVGDSVTHRIVVTNRSRVAATALVITDTRDAGLEHNIAERQIEKSLGDLGPMQSQVVTITFRAVEAGQPCHTVRITGAGGVSAESRACIDVQERTAEQPGPSPPDSGRTPWNEPEPPSEPPRGAPDRTVPPPATPPFQVRTYFAVGGEPPQPIERAGAGESVLLIVDVVSEDERPLTGLTVALDMPESFEAQEASEDYRKRGAGFSWENQTVPSDTVGRYAVKCLLREPATEACIYATVSDSSGRQETDDACIPVLPAEEPSRTKPPVPREKPQPQLDVRVNTTHGSASEGSTITYVVQVTNQAATADRDVALTVAFPGGLIPQYWRSKGPTPFKIRDNKAIFEAVPVLPGGDQLEYTVRVVAEEAREEYTVLAEVTSVNQPEGVVGRDTLRVVPAF